MVLDAKDADGRWLISPELLAVQFGVSTVTIYNVLRRARNKNAPPSDQSGACDSPLGVDRGTSCLSDTTLSPNPA